MRAIGLGTILAVVYGLAASAVVLRRTMLARGHRDVGDFALGVVATLGLLTATASFVVAPGVWLSLYRVLIGIYEGGT